MQNSDRWRRRLDRENHYRKINVKVYLTATSAKKLYVEGYEKNTNPDGHCGQMIQNEYQFAKYMTKK